jgi:hypothetical protein
MLACSTLSGVSDGCLDGAGVWNLAPLTSPLAFVGFVASAGLAALAVFGAASAGAGLMVSFCLAALLPLLDFK